MACNKYCIVGDFLDLQHARIVRLYVLVVDCSFGYQYLTFKKPVGQLFETKKQMRKRTIEGFVLKVSVSFDSVYC